VQVFTQVHVQGWLLSNAGVFAADALASLCMSCFPQADLRTHKRDRPTLLHNIAA
jgi:hypothetical protein